MGMKTPFKSLADNIELIFVLEILMYAISEAHLKFCLRNECLSRMHSSFGCDDVFY